MWLVLIAMAWYVVGLVGYALICELDRRGGSDITVGDIVEGVLIAVLGPTAMVVFLVLLISCLRRHKKARIVIFPARRAH